MSLGGAPPFFSRPWRKESGDFDSLNSWPLKILPATCCSPWIKSKFLANPMILKDHRGGGGVNANGKISQSLSASQNQRHSERIARPAPPSLLLFPQAFPGRTHPT